MLQSREWGWHFHNGSTSAWNAWFGKHCSNKLNKITDWLIFIRIKKLYCSLLFFGGLFLWRRKKLKFIKNKNMYLIYFCQLITVLKSGKVQIRDTLQGTVLCEPILPKSHELMTPWDPVVAVGAMGQVLFLKGKQKHKINAMNVRLTSLLPNIYFQWVYYGKSNRCKLGK